MTRFKCWRLPLLLGACLALGGAEMGALAARAGAVCVGDCGGDGRVSIADVQACVNLGANLTAPPCAAADQNLDGTVGDNEVDACIQSFLDADTCPMVFTPVPTATITVTPTLTATNTPVSTDTPVPTNTPVPTDTPVPTSTDTPAPTATEMDTPTPTVTPTPTIGELACVLATSPPPSILSGIKLHIAALPVPLVFSMSGTIGLGANPADASGNSEASCSVREINAINIPSIGFVCIQQPDEPCPVGRRDCVGGRTPLGVDLPSDGNVGACTSNAQCRTACIAHCGGVEEKVQNASCTGFCSGGDESACALDADCLVEPKGGACNGKDNLAPSQKNICQCSCAFNDAHGPSEAGDFQCNLAASLNVEDAAPCGDGDIKIEVGSTCIPVSTQRASSLVSDANFIAGSTVPGNPAANILDGTTVSCATLDAGAVTGIKGVGAVNFFGSSLGDLAVGLIAQCQ